MKLLRSLKKNKIIQMILSYVRIIYFFPYLYYVSKEKFEVSSPLETVKKISSKKNSVTRFGDGEFNIIFRSKGTGFQAYNEQLSNDLKKVLKEDNDRFVQVAIPHGYNSTKIDRFRVKTFWWSYVVRKHRDIQQFQSWTAHKKYLDASFTRVITELDDRKEIHLVIDGIKKIWQNKNVLIVEGSGTRFGSGNDLLKNARSVSRIIAPAANAYDRIEEIRASIDEFISLQDDLENVVILIALGPTATVLANDYSVKVQSIDIGHFDLQYEYLQKGSYDRVEIKDRYDNEMSGGAGYSSNTDSKYKNEIFSVINY
ncbi:hypothetical protein [Lactobacillus brevis] [Lactiplantibacillus mudanjiangensis]|uniref:GT-D fold domain-containing glycosyltransferase n=1 Tax=Lactiplantibacillus mudanjiangensis TaxID=1296538 RepID=UPI00101480DE|nr:GT-D fold domain-containing glycosyltransferase [Lactiplantibacillus mudanjiangensis]VDG32745.1 hypothetical protein [Lactobacillus brevis] [Lactiplantibacillus mudanjiangensis]